MEILSVFLWYTEEYVKAYSLLRDWMINTENIYNENPEPHKTEIVSNLIEGLFGLKTEERKSFKDDLFSLGIVKDFEKKNRMYPASLSRMESNTLNKEMKSMLIKRKKSAYIRVKELYTTRICQN